MKKKVFTSNPEKIKSNLNLASIGMTSQVGLPLIDWLSPGFGSLLVFTQRSGGATTKRKHKYGCLNGLSAESLCFSKRSTALVCKVASRQMGPEWRCLAIMYSTTFSENQFKLLYTSTSNNSNLLRKKHPQLTIILASSFYPLEELSSASCCKYSAAQV